jgi:hypothetical protein
MRGFRLRQDAGTAAHDLKLVIDCELALLSLPVRHSAQHLMNYSIQTSARSACRDNGEPAQR